MTLILCNALPLKHWLKALKDLGLKPNATKFIWHMTGYVYIQFNARCQVLHYATIICATFLGNICLFSGVHFSYTFAFPLIQLCRYSNVNIATNWFYNSEGNGLSIKQTKNIILHVNTLTWMASLRVTCSQEVTATYLNYIYCKYNMQRKILEWEKQ